MTEFRVEVFGITVLLPDQQVVVFPDGRLPRISWSDGSVIPPHHGFFACESGTYEAQIPARFSFNFDVEGTGQKRRFDAWLLNRHEIRFENEADDEVSIDDSYIVSMRELVPEASLRDDARSTATDRLSGLLHVANASRVVGEDQGLDPLRVVIGGEVRECAAKLAVTFSGKAAPVRVRLFNKAEENVIAFGEEASVVITGNSPLEDLLGGLMMPAEPNTPLTHAELVYALFDVPQEAAVSVPVRLNAHHHAQTGVSATCGMVFEP